MDQLVLGLVFFCDGRGERVEGEMFSNLHRRRLLICPPVKSLILLAKYTLGSARWKQFERYRLTLRKGKAGLSHIFTNEIGLNDTGIDRVALRFLESAHGPVAADWRNAIRYLYVLEWEKQIRSAHGYPGTLILAQCAIPA
jgi:hypothetical protein